MEENHKEMQLFSSCNIIPHASQPSPPLLRPSVDSSAIFRSIQGTCPSLDLQLSISLTPLIKPPYDGAAIRGKVMREYMKEMEIDSSSCVEALKWQAAEQIRLASMENSYAEGLRELTRREMEQAQDEFARARNLWKRARDEVERVQKLRERVAASARSNSTCREITCQSCRLKFRP